MVGLSTMAHAQQISAETPKPQKVSEKKEKEPKNEQEKFENCEAKELTKRQREFVAKKMKLRQEWENDSHFKDRGPIVIKTHNAHQLDYIQPFLCKTTESAVPDNFGDVHFDDKSYKFYKIGTAVDEIQPIKSAVFETMSDGTSGTIMTASIKMNSLRRY
uniref:Uncharacterized protein n=1 Tax=Caenorhabditis japonica TaxID=281687 RepID=A0A8R1IKE5_CAEJA